MITAKKKVQGGFQVSSNITHWFILKVLFLLSILGISTYPDTICAQEFIKMQERLSLNTTADNKTKEMQEKLQKDMKFILRWNTDNTNLFKSEQEAFLQKNCPNINCYVTENRTLFGGDLSRFHAITFDTHGFEEHLPKERYSHQKYIFVTMESPGSMGLCSKKLDNFFNWTFTYRLDSDIIRPYLHVKDMNNNILGPKQDMQWEEMQWEYHDDVLDSKLESIWSQKKLAAAWIVSHCVTPNKREVYAQLLTRKLEQANLALNVFGHCGPTRCENCWDNIRTDYFFYLSFENSNCVDYVTEKLYNPLRHYVIPIVFGGANYSRFLPPKSYLDARNMSVDHMVYKMKEIINSKQVFKEYHRWRSYYKYVDAELEGDNICRLCAALNDEEKMRTTTVYGEFRVWWNIDITKCISNAVDVKITHTKTGDIIKTDTFRDLRVTWCSKKSNIFKKMFCEFSIMLHNVFSSFVTSSNIYQQET